MNFSLPWIFILLCRDSINNFKFSVRPATPTLEVSPHQTDGERVPGGGVRVLSEESELCVLRPVHLAVLLRSGLVPAGHEEDTVPVNIAPVIRTLGWTGAHTGKVPGVGLGHGQP